MPAERSRGGDDIFGRLRVVVRHPTERNADDGADHAGYPHWDQRIMLVPCLLGGCVVPASGILR